MRNCNCSATTSIADTIEYGHGELSFNGFWEFPCTHGSSWDEEPGPNEYETFVKLILPEAVRKLGEEGFGNYLVYANDHTEWPLVDEFSDVPWLDAACALGYPVPEEEDEE